MIEFDLNGKPVAVNSSGDRPLLWVLREELHLTGTKFGCGIGQCGACTVHIDETVARSCMTRIDAVEGKKVTTIEGADDATTNCIKSAWCELNVVQCGYCQSGQIMAATMLLRKNPQPTDPDIDAAMIGQICRCATYQRIRAAIHLAAKSVKA